MKKNRVDEILIDQTKRRRKIISYVCIITVISIIFLTLLMFYISSTKDYYVSYDESSNIDYKVYLKDNEFYENNYLEKNNQYIASLIDYIDADFNYKLSMEDKDVDYSYSYKIDAVVNVKEKSTNNSLYYTTENLLEEINYTSNSDENVNINENIKINYNHYNDLIKRFISIYDLDDIESTLTLNLTVSVLGTCDEFSDNSNNVSVVSLVIPLTTNTIAIDITSDLIDNDDNIMVCKKENQFAFLIIIIDTLVLLLDLYLVVRLVRYIVTTRTAESIYDGELKKILNNYRSYIQKINNEFDLKGYQVLKVDTFTDMLEIRDTIQEPILMVENQDKTGTYFIIPSKTKILYSYGLKVSDIKKKMLEGSIDL